MNVEACNSPQEEQGTAQGEVLLDTRCPAASYGRLRPFSAAAIAQTYIHADQLSLVFERVAAAADRKLCALGEPAQQLWLKSLGSWSAFGLQLGPRTARPDLQGSRRSAAWITSSWPISQLHWLTCAPKLPSRNPDCSR